MPRAGRATVYLFHVSPGERQRYSSQSETNNSFFLLAFIESEASYAIVVGLENEDDGMFPPKKIFMY